MLDAFAILQPLTVANFTFSVCVTGLLPAKNHLVILLIYIAQLPNYFLPVLHKTEKLFGTHIYEFIRFTNRQFAVVFTASYISSKH